MASLPPPLVINADPELIQRSISVLNQLEAFVDGVSAGHGPNAPIPRVMVEEFDQVRDELHALVCPACAAKAAAGNSPAGRAQKSAKVLVIDGGKTPPDGDTKR